MKSLVVTDEISSLTPPAISKDWEAFNQTNKLRTVFSTPNENVLILHMKPLPRLPTNAHDTDPIVQMI